jgi:hypothetical protein
MISIIICSVNETLLHQCAENIRALVGVEYELIVFDNRGKNRPISEVYNQAAARSKYDVLCFLHEDVLFYTNGWGTKAAAVLNNVRIGLLGFVGGIYKAKVPSGWIDLPHSHRRANMKTRHGDKLLDYVMKSGVNETLSDTVTLDGFCLMMRKEVWKEFKFDEESLRGFHFYDVDISLRIVKKYRLVVCHDIFAEHLSPGNFGAEWINEALVFHQRYFEKLPVWIDVDKQGERNFLESFALKRFLEKSKAANVLDRKLVSRLLFNYPVCTIRNFLFLIRLKRNN